jgi:hypothetical protein
VRKKYGRRGIDWDSQPLGLEPESVIAERLGVTKSVVHRHRRQRGLPPFGRELLALPRTATAAEKRKRRGVVVRAAQHRYRASLRAESKAKGWNLCCKCLVQEAAEERSTCTECGDKLRVWHRERARRIHAEGILCRNCKARKPKKGMKTCARCLRTRRRWYHANESPRSVVRVDAREGALRVLSARAVSLRTLAAELEIAYEHAIRTVNGLEKRGLVTRLRTDEMDGTEVWVRLTKAGREAVNALPPVYEAQRRSA